jgi:endonuclease YncB( thermonuclease family)
MIPPKMLRLLRFRFPTTATRVAVAMVLCALIPLPVRSQTTAGTEEIPATKVFEGEGVGSGDAELDKLERDYLDAVVKARQELGDKYLAALQRLQDTLTQGGKLTDALLVKQERERTLELLEQRPEAAAVADSRVTVEPVFLLGKDATIEGKLKISAANGALFAWEKKGTHAEWMLPEGMVPGEYEIILHCSAAEGEGGGFDVTLGDDQVLSATVAGEGDWSDWRDLHAGNFTVGSKGGALRVTASSFANVRLMNLQHVMLAPVGTWERIQKGETITPPVGNTAKIRRGSEPDADFTEIKNARYVSKPENDADSFVVSDGTEEYPLRLYFVDVPHGNAADYRKEDPQSMRNIENEAEYFGITPQESMAIGKEAASYVSRLLAGQSLTVYTRKERDTRRSERFYGMVIVGGKALSTLLVENGYARIEGATTVLPNGSDAASYLEILKKAEATAKSARRGAWGKSR